MLDWYPKPHTSISALQSFEYCPLSFYLRYYLGVKAPEKERVKFGRQFQEVLNAKYAGQDPELILKQMDPKNKGLAKLLLLKAEDFEGASIMSVDEPDIVDLALGIPVKYAIDLLTDDAVIENKTTTGYYNEKMVHRQRQATLYQLATKVKYGFEPKIIYQIFNVYKKSMQLVETERNVEQAAELIDWMMRTLRRIKDCHDTGKWTTNVHSKFPCDFHYLCPDYLNGK
jgi:CRISPR/Cas system-associated exonuclease Cas4 (RecB family)